MLKIITKTIILILFISLCNCQIVIQDYAGFEPKIRFTEEQLRDKLTSMQFYVIVGEGTEFPGPTEFDDHWEDGIYNCVVCNKALFDSKDKIVNDKGQPGFLKPYGHTGELEIKPYDNVNREIGNITEIDAKLYDAKVRAIMCTNCGGYLGVHILDNIKVVKVGINKQYVKRVRKSPKYVINSAAFNFAPVVYD